MTVLKRQSSFAFGLIVVMLMAGCTNHVQNDVKVDDDSALQPTNKKKQICRDEKIPVGWVIENATRDARCPSSPSDLRPTRYWITDLSDRTVGSEITICMFSSVPKGWKVVEEIRVLSRCYASYPPSGNRPTIKKIKKL